MLGKPLVSICMPAYNAEAYIAQAINSLLAQSYENIEIIIINDGSTDGTTGILNSYQQPNIKIFHQANKGQCAAANLAFHHSTGEYIKFMDADDLISADFIKNQVHVLNNNRNQVASASWGRFYNDDLNSFKLNPEPVWKDMKPIDWLVESFWNGANMMQCALWLIPREILHKSGLWNERLSLINDFDFFIRVLLTAEEIKFTSDAILYYRSGIENSLSKQKSRKAHESAFLSTKLGIEYLLAAENSNRVRKIAADNMRMWSYEFYPRHMDLYHKSEEIIKSLGGSSFEFPAGGITANLVRVLGWKLTKRIKQLLNS